LKPQPIKKDTVQHSTKPQTMNEQQYYQEEEKELTPEERTDWLRARGIEIETPQDRRRQQQLLTTTTTTNVQLHQGRRAAAVTSGQQLSTKTAYEKATLASQGIPQTDDHDHDYSSTISGGGGQLRPSSSSSPPPLYSWTQSEQEVELVIPISSIVQGGDDDNNNSSTTPMTTNPSSKYDFIVTFKPRQVEISFRHHPQSHYLSVLLLDLFECVLVEKCTWTYIETTAMKTAVPGLLVITLQKLEEALWPRIVSN
jgi:CS domain